MVLSNGYHFFHKFKISYIFYWHPLIMNLLNASETLMCIKLDYKEESKGLRCPNLKINY